MPYSDPEVAKQRARERMQRIRGRTSGEQQGEHFEGERGEQGEQVTGEQKTVTPVTPTERSYVCLETGEISDGEPTGRTGTKGSENAGLRGEQRQGEQALFPCSVDRIPIDPQWAGVREAMLRNPDTLAKLQAVAGSLGKLAGGVRFGLSGPTFEELGRTIGVGGPVSPHVGAPVLLASQAHIMDFGKRA